MNQALTTAPEITPGGILTLTGTPLATKGDQS